MYSPTVLCTKARSGVRQSGSCVVKNMASEHEYYYGWGDLEGLVAAFSDPRAKKNPHFLAHSVRARNEFGRRLEFVLAQDLEDDPDENAVSGASSEASGPPSPAAPMLVEFASIFDFDDEPDAAAEPVPASSPLVGSKRRLEVAPKTREKMDSGFAASALDA